MHAAERRAQLLACAKAVAEIATHRAIVPRLAVAVKEDVEVRPVLETVVRRWTRLVKPTFISEGVRSSGEKGHGEHVVPCRVLVDRMIMEPGQCAELLNDAVVIALVTKAEHQRLGGIYTHHPELYAEMLTVPVADLAGLGSQRYQRAGISLHPIAEPAQHSLLT